MRPFGLRVCLSECVFLCLSGLAVFRNLDYGDFATAVTGQEALAPVSLGMNNSGPLTLSAGREWDARPLP